MAWVDAPPWEMELGFWGCSVVEAMEGNWNDIKESGNNAEMEGFDFGRKFGRWVSGFHSHPHQFCLQNVQMRSLYDVDGKFVKTPIGKFWTFPPTTKQPFLNKLFSLYPKTNLQSIFLTFPQTQYSPAIQIHHL